jgi:hypothetical protein
MTRQSAHPARVGGTGPLRGKAMNSDGQAELRGEEHREADKSEKK